MKNDNGSLHKQERDQLWQINRKQKADKLSKQRKHCRTVKKQVNDQMFRTNVARMEDIMRASAERKDLELQQLNDLGEYVAERNQRANEDENQMIGNIEAIDQKIRSLRKYGREKDKVLSYLEKRSQTRMSQMKAAGTSLHLQYFHEFNRFTPTNMGLRVKQDSL